MRQSLFWLSDKQWVRVAPHLPTDVRGKKRVDDRRVISGILHVLKTGSRWCDLPPEYGPHTTIYNPLCPLGTAWSLGKAVPRSRQAGAVGASAND